MVNFSSQFIQISCKWLLAILVVLSAAISFAGDRGKMQFGLCMSCHGEKGEGQKHLGAPGIAGLPEWYLVTQLQNFKEGIRGLHPKDIPGMRMAPMARSLRRKGDLEAVAKYVAQLPLVTKKYKHKGNKETGQGHYAMCIACHGPKGKGLKEMGAPPISQMDPWYMVTQLKNFKSGVRGAHPKDTKGATMVPMAKVLADDKAINDVVAYIMSLKK